MLYITSFSTIKLLRYLADLIDYIDCSTLLSDKTFGHSQKSRDTSRQQEMTQLIDMVQRQRQEWLELQCAHQQQLVDLVKKHREEFTQYAQDPSRPQAVVATTIDMVVDDGGIPVVAVVDTKRKREDLLEEPQSEKRTKRETFIKRDNRPQKDDIVAVFYEAAGRKKEIYYTGKVVEVLGEDTYNLAHHPTGGHFTDNPVQLCMKDQCKDEDNTNRWHFV